MVVERHAHIWDHRAAFLSHTQAIIAQAPIPLQQLDRAIDDGADYLVRQLRTNGQFVYRVNTNPAVHVEPKYNIVRHAGTMYCLAQYYELRRLPSVKRVLLKACNFLQSQVAEAADVPEVLAVWSDPKINLGGDERKAKLGGTGLGLAALSQLESIQKDTTEPKQLKWLGNFLLFMQKDDGGFYSLYLSEFPGRDDSWTSLYYPGEAALGLLVLNKIHRDPEWVMGAGEALSYLAQTRRGASVVPPDQWSLIATRELLKQDLADLKIDTGALVSHARQIVQSMLQEQKSQHDHATLNGCFSNDGRTTPTSTRLEGLLATLDFLPAEHRELRDQIDAACHRGIQFLLANQNSEGETKGGIPRAVAPLDADHPGWDPSFNERATEIRIDYVQHALSAMIAYRLRFYGQAETGEQAR